jgi:hypothetical protein
MPWREAGRYGPGPDLWGLLLQQFGGANTRERLTLKSLEEWVVPKNAGNP